MEYRKLGNTGLEVSILGFGASPLGAEFGEIDPKEGRRAVDRAIEYGLNYFDVAPYYGRTLAETRLGDYLSGKRHRVVLATKVGRYDRDRPEGFDFSARRVARSIEESLSRLRTDYIDVFQVHDVEFGRKEQIVEETLPAMQKLKDQGKARAIGITGYPLAILKDIATAANLDTILSYCRYTLLNTTLETELAPFAHANQIGLINASPLHMRVLTEMGAPSWHPAPEMVHRTARQVSEFCENRGVDIADLAMQFALSYPGVATTVVGMSCIDHVDQNISLIGTTPDSELLGEVMRLINPAANINWKSGLPQNSDPDAI